MQRLKSVVRRFRLRNLLSVYDIVISEEEILERDTFDQMLRDKPVGDVFRILFRNFIYIPRQNYDINASLRHKLQKILAPVLFGLVMFITR